MNKLTTGVIAFWLGSIVALIWSHNVERSQIESGETIGILYYIHFVFFLIGLGCLICRIIQWYKSRSH